MKPRTLVAVVVLLVAAIVAAILLSVSVTATASGGQAVSCGNGFKTDMSEAAHQSNVDALTNAYAADAGSSIRVGSGTDDYQASCESALSTRRGFGWGALGGGVLAFACVLAIRRPTQTGTPPASAA